MKRIILVILIVIAIFLGIISFKNLFYNKYISSEEAKEIATKDVSNKDGIYLFNSVEFKETNNTYIYILEFSDKVNIYTYKINAKNKKIISSKKESISNNKVYMKEDNILEIVFKNAKLNRNECNLISNLITLEDGFPIYNVIFYYNNIKYEYKVNAFTGSIISVTKLNENAV